VAAGGGARVLRTGERAGAVRGKGTGGRAGAARVGRALI
jgi:hypothetical protein